jgi:hypothetical protein
VDFQRSDRARLKVDTADNPDSHAGQIFGKRRDRRYAWQMNLHRARKGLSWLSPAFDEPRSLDFHHQPVDFFLHISPVICASVI